MSNTKITSHVIESGAVESTHIASGAITASHVTGITTANITENTNLYYTNARARSSISVTGGNLSYDSSTGVIQLTDSEIRDALSAGTGVTYSGGQISIGQAVGTGDTVTFGNITTSGYLRGPSTFTIDPAAYGDDTGTLIIAGNLQVDGTTTTINSTTMTVDDLNLTLASGAANAAAANGAGITVDGASASITYESSSDSWNLNKATIAARLNSNTLNNEGNTANIIYRSSSKTIVGNNATALVVQDGGNVGIGTSSPGVKLDVRGEIAVGYDATYGLRFYNQGRSNWSSIGNFATDTTADLNFKTGGGLTMTMTHQMNVGIGTDSPGRKLHLKDGQIKFQNTGSGGWAGLDFSMGNGTYDGYMGMLDSDGKFFIDVDSNGNDFVILQNGNVGIGTNSPDYKLEVVGNTMIGDASAVTSPSFGARQNIVSSFSHGANGIGRSGSLYLLNTNTNRESGFLTFGAYYNNTNNLYYHTGGIGGGKETAAGDNTWGGYLSFWTTSDGTAGAASGQFEHMRITADGNVGIGLTNPTTQLHMKHASGPTLMMTRTSTNTSGEIGQIVFGNADWDSSMARIVAIQDGTNDGARLEFKTQYNAAGTEQIRMVINKSGNVGIGTNSPTQKLEVAGTALVENAKLKAIAESNTDTAVDVFVYDTSKDSDGGAWRKRTQHTSWYNETLNTSTRGARKEFPSVAVIVAESNKVTIYDGDDIDMPMWIVFLNGTWSSYALTSNQTLTTVAAKNGGVAAGSSTYGYKHINFISELCRFREKGYNHLLSGGVVNRNGGMTAALAPEGLAGELAGDPVYDIAITVLPNAPIDVGTGLPVPTIAVATNAGVSVIKDDGNVFDIVNTQDSSAFNYIDNLFFRKDGALVWVGDSSSNTAAERFVQVLHNLPTTDTNQGSVENSSVIDEQYGPSHKTGSELRWATTAGVKATSDAGENFAVGTSGALHLINYNREVEQEGAIAHITSDYNTGYMHGSIKLATLSDTDTTNAVSTDVLGGIGNFTDANAWNVPSGWSLSSNVATGSAVTAYITPVSNGMLTTGKKYAVTVTQSSYTSGAVYMYVGTGAPSGVYYASLPSSPGTYTFVLTAYNNNFGIYGANYTGVIDNVTISLAEEDRSYNNNGLQVFGTVTKTAVATGAELVAYSGFNASNYLEQPYSSDLDFNSGDVAYCFWSNNPHTQSEYIADRAEGNGNYRTALYLSNNDGGSMNFYTRDTAATEVTGIIGTPNQWVQIWCIRRGTSHEIWVNGVNKVANVGTVRDVSAASGDAVQKIGVRYNNTAHNTGKIALFRVSATAPSAEQIKKIYNDEKHLFLDNAKATIAGTSDEVTALAYDDDTELLHVGSSWGRSVFQGLNRVEYSTDVVTTAISASNGFIVEE